MSWPHTFIWSYLQGLKRQWSTFCLHMKSTRSGEHLGNAIVCSSLFKALLTRHLLALATRIILVATVHEIEKNEWNISKKSILGRREDTSKADSYFQGRLHL